MLLKSLEEIAIIRENCLLTNQAIAAVIPFISEGITTARIDKIIEEFIRDHGANPAFKNYEGYPFATCISVNDAVVHGFPNQEPLREGDIVSIDVGSLAQDFYSDTAYTVLLGAGDEAKRNLLHKTKTALELGVAQARVGNKIGDIGAAIQAEVVGYGVVRSLVGHGLGRDLHEKPEVPNYGKAGRGVTLKKGLVIAIEPMVTLGSHEVFVDKDGWTIRTKDGSSSAHFEHAVTIGDEGGIKLSDFTCIEEAVRKNSNLWNEQL